MIKKFEFLYRKKQLNSIHEDPSKLKRALNSFDLTTLGMEKRDSLIFKRFFYNLKGVGWTLGGTIYILIGETIVKHTGPSIILSFIIAGFASFLSGLTAVL